MTRLIPGTGANSVDDRLIKHFAGTAVISAQVFGSKYVFKLRD
jgi:hypothetical protein